MLRQLLLSTALIAAVSTPVLASSFNKKYFKLDAGISFTSPSKFTSEYAGTSFANPIKFTSDEKAKYSGSMTYGAGIGTEITDGFRAEFNITKRNIQSKYKANVYLDVENIENVNTDFTLSYRPLTYMANIYYDFKLDDIFTPYASIGLGMTQFKPVSKFKITLPDNDDLSAKILFKKERVASWQLGLGTGIKATENIIFDVGYKYTHLANLKPQKHNVELKGYSTPITKLASHEFIAGLRIGF